MTFQTKTETIPVGQRAEITDQTELEDGDVVVALRAGAPVEVPYKVPTGLQGPQGPIGPVGLAGADGADGVVGLQGPQGDPDLYDHTALQTQADASTAALILKASQADLDTQEAKQDTHEQSNIRHFPVGGTASQFTRKAADGVTLEWADQPAPSAANSLVGFGPPPDSLGADGYYYHQLDAVASAFDGYGKKVGGTWPAASFNFEEQIVKSTTAPIKPDDNVGAAGSSAQVARADHKHPLPDQPQRIRHTTVNFDFNALGLPDHQLILVQNINTVSSIQVTYGSGGTTNLNSSLLGGTQAIISGQDSFTLIPGRLALLEKDGSTVYATILETSTIRVYQDISEAQSAGMQPYNAVVLISGEGVWIRKTGTSVAFSGVEDANWGRVDSPAVETWVRFADEQKHVAEINKNYTIPDRVLTPQQQIQIPDAATVPTDSVIKLRNIDQYDLSPVDAPIIVDFDAFGPPLGTPTTSNINGDNAGIYPLSTDTTGAPAAGKMEVWTLTSTVDDWIVGYEVSDIPTPEGLPAHLGTYVLDAASSATVTATTTPTKQGLLATRAVGDNQQVATFNLPIKQITVIDLYILKASIDAANPPAFSIRGSSPPSFCYRKPNSTTGVLETDATVADTNCLLDIQQFHDLGDQWFYRLKYTFTDISGFTAYRFNMLPSGITATSPSAAVEFSFRAYDPVESLSAIEDVLIDVEGVNNTLYPFAGSITWGQTKAIYSYLRITGNLSKSGTAYIRPWGITIDLGSSAAAIGQSGYAMEFADINGVFIFANSPSDTDTGLTYRQTGGDGPGGNGRMQFKVVGVKR